MTVTAPPPRTPPPPPSVPPNAASLGVPPPRPHRRRAGLRIFLGCLIVLVCGAGAGATFVLEQVHTLQEALAQNPSLNIAPSVLAPSGYGSPETLLLVGNDQRNHTTTTPVLPHSNEMLLVRIDPGKPYISMMSIPRELEVTITPPNQAPITTRLNYAYTAGGIPLLVSTIKQVTGLSVNHVVVIDFNQFKRAVDELGCVYSTIDRRDYHVNTPTSEQYQEINLQPGYQDLCGAQALQFVSYRHGDTSLVRDARDQSFLLDVKKQYGPTLIDNIGKFEQIFGRTVQTDPGLKSAGGLLNLVGTLIDSSSLRVRQVPFQANLVPVSATPCACVTASAQQIAASVHAFLHGGSPLPTRSTAAVARALSSRKAVAQLPLVASGSSQLANARGAAHGMSFPYEYPRVQDRGGSGVPVSLRDYLIHAPGGQAFPIYVAVFSAGQLGQYYDVQGTTWTTAPLFDSPDQTVDASGRTYFLDYSGQHLEIVAWYEHGAAYWIRNSLTDAVSNGKLLAIAEQTRPVTAVDGSRARADRSLVQLNATAIPARTSTAPPIDLRQTLGSLAGLLTLLVVPVLAIPLIRRRRELSELRAGLHAHSLREAQLSAAVAGATLPPAAPASPGYSTMNVYAADPARLRGRVLTGLSVAAIATAGVLGVLVATHRGTVRIVPAARHVTRAAAAKKDADIPGVPVAVLNATSTPGAASRLAQQLRSDGVGIAAVANLAESRPPGLWVLYPPGHRNQAAKLARLLPGQVPAIAPIDPVAQAAAGSAARLVVVIT